MPIRPDLRHHYGPAWRETRKAILERARHQCEECHKPNYTDVWTITGKTEAGKAFMLWRLVEPVPERYSGWMNAEGWPARLEEYILLADARFRRRRIRVVLTVAHRNHVAGEDGHENLAAWCQWCHLIYDLEHHKETRCKRKDRERPVLALVEGAL